MSQQGSLKTPRLLGPNRFRIGFVLASLLLSACAKITIGNDSLQSGIVNGSTVNGTESFAPSVIGLATKSPASGYSIFCSGTLIGNNTIVTAAHCLTDMSRPTYVVFGLIEENVEGRLITHSAANAGYIVDAPDDAKDIYDIGLAQFEGVAPKGYAPIEILPDETMLKTGSEVLLAGYGVDSATPQGKSGILRYTKVKIQNSAYGKTEVITDETATGSCNGDSGGPGLIEVNGKYYSWGVTSRGDAACVKDGIYTKVTSYRAWIDQQMQAFASVEPPSAGKVAAGF